MDRWAGTIMTPCQRFVFVMSDPLYLEPWCDTETFEHAQKNLFAECSGFRGGSN